MTWDGRISGRWDGTLLKKFCFGIWKFNTFDYIICLIHNLSFNSVEIIHFFYSFFFVLLFVHFFIFIFVLLSVFYFFFLFFFFSIYFFLVVSFGGLSFSFKDLFFIKKFRFLTKLIFPFKISSKQRIVH